MRDDHRPPPVSRVVVTLPAALVRLFPGAVPRVELHAATVARLKEWTA